MMITGGATGSNPARVSIVIPTHNRAGLLRLAVDSALAQTYPQVEVIVVDDGSTDGTAAMVAQYGERVTYLRQANRDVAAARNTGIRAASGDYLAFLDDDDLILPDKIERQAQVLAARPEARRFGHALPRRARFDRARAGAPGLRSERGALPARGGAACAGPGSDLPRPARRRRLGGGAERERRRDAARCRSAGARRGRRSVPRDGVGRVRDHR